MHAFKEPDAYENTLITLVYVKSKKLAKVIFGLEAKTVVTLGGEVGGWGIGEASGEGIYRRPLRILKIRQRVCEIKNTIIINIEVICPFLLSFSHKCSVNIPEAP